VDSPENLPKTPATSSNLTDKTLDVVSKSVAVVAILVYACGFLITSIYHASYGFLEVDPLRPRILFAGTWFIVFMAFPIILGWRFLRQDHWQSEEPWWLKLRGFLFDYYGGGVSVIGILLFSKIFDFDPYAPAPAHSTGPHHWWELSGWKLVIAVVTGAIGSLVLFVIVAVQCRKHVPEKWLRAGVCLWTGERIVAVGGLRGEPRRRRGRENKKTDCERLHSWRFRPPISTIGTISGRQKAPPKPRSRGT
jgi:hypothetical protein